LPPRRCPALSVGVFLAKLYAGLLAGLSPRDLSRAFESAALHPIRFAVTDMEAALIPVSGAAVTAPAPTVPPPAVVERSLPPEPDPFEVALRRKRAAGDFDVFLCHNWADKPAVIRLADRLKGAGILPWLDVWELRPGLPWQLLLEQQIASIRSAAVLVGAAGLGPWQQQEMYGFLRQFVSRSAPVIPVLLEDAPAEPKLPLFLEGMTWVDFRAGDRDAFDRLIWGITGRRPGE
jgi:hypothetical protein